MQHTVSPAAVDNSLSPHGGRLIERATRQEIKEKWPSGLAALPEWLSGTRSSGVRQYRLWVFPPLEGFMGQVDVDAVAQHMTLASGYIWSMPIVFDLSQETLDRLGVKPGDTLLLTYQQQPLAVLEVTEIYTYDRVLARQIMARPIPPIREWHAPLPTRTVSWPVRSRWSIRPGLIRHLTASG